MKVSKIAYTDYPIEFDMGVEGAQQKVPVQRIFVEEYDGNKYCPVHLVDEMGKRISETCSIKIGYIFMDKEMKHRPNRKTCFSWEGINREPKKRIKKRFYEISALILEEKDEEGKHVEIFPKRQERKLSNLKEVHRAIQRLVKEHGEEKVCQVEVCQFVQYGLYSWQYETLREVIIWGKNILARKYKGRWIYVRNIDGTYKYA